MKKIKYVKLVAAILYILFGFLLTIYFAIVGAIGVFVICQEVMRKFIPVYTDMNGEAVFIVCIILSSLLGMLPFGIAAAICMKHWMIKWKVPTIQDSYDR
jgi:hypothetical protein